MVSFNRVVLAGNLTRDPELRVTQNGVAVCNFPIAVDRISSKKSSEAVDFFNVSCWRELGERVANHKKKGDPILVEGRLQYRTWQAPDGAKRSAVEVVADRVQFLSRAQNPQAENNPQAAEVAAGASAKIGARRTAAAAPLLGERADGVLRPSNCTTTMEQMIPTLRRKASRRSVLNSRRGRLSQRPHRTTPKEELQRQADKQPAHAEKKMGEEEALLL